MKPVFFLDCDGCLASQGKIWYERPIIGKADDSDGSAYLHRNGLGVYKIISDHDSWAIDAIKDKAHVIIISGDTRINQNWAERRGVPFIFTASGAAHGDKWEHLKKYWEENFKGKPTRNYFYLGDAMPDFVCMAKSKMAFYPKDACLTLKRYAEQYGHIAELGTESGKGVFEAMLDVMIQAELLPKDFV